LVAGPPPQSSRQYSKRSRDRAGNRLPPTSESHATVKNVVAESLKLTKCFEISQISQSSISGAASVTVAGYQKR
jgi:hypothetical protein